jgi:hypothetical protein
MKILWHAALQLKHILCWSDFADKPLSAYPIVSSMANQIKQNQWGKNVSLADLKCTFFRDVPLALSALVCAVTLKKKLQSHLLQFCTGLSLALVLSSCHLLSIM